MTDAQLRLDPSRLSEANAALNRAISARAALGTNDVEQGDRSEAQRDAIVAADESVRDASTELRTARLEATNYAANADGTR